MTGRTSELDETGPRYGVLGELLDEKQIALPGWTGTATELREYFTDQFWQVFESWRKFNAGMGLPGPGPWPDNNPDLIDAILWMQEDWTGH